MRWLACFTCLLLLSGLLAKAVEWEEDTAKEGRWLIRRKRAAKEEVVRRKRDVIQEDEEVEEVVRRKGDVEEGEEEDGLFDHLTNSESNSDSEGEIVPKERVGSLKVCQSFSFIKLLQYSELEEKIPGLKDGMFKSPADGEWKKVRMEKCLRY